MQGTLRTDVTYSPDGTRRLFLVSPRGIVRIFKDGALLATHFLDAPASPVDMAMTGLAFHPDFVTNGKLYVVTGEAVPNGSTPHCSAPQNDSASDFDSVLVEYTVSAGDPNVVDPASRRELLRVHQAHALHGMDDPTFGGDGYLYVSMGDGGATREGTPAHYESTAQDTGNPFGGVLRIDVDTIGPNGRYAIPPENPFVAGAVPELYCWGLRNPWRISTDRLTGEVYTAVNGDFTIETIVRVENGKNYGWAVREGSFLWDPLSGNATLDPSPDPAFTPPLAEYDHNGTAAFGSCIGGSLYRGGRLIGLAGMFLLHPWVAGRLIARDPVSGALELVAIDPGGVQLMATRDSPMGEDQDGEQYIGRINGEVLRIESGAKVRRAGPP
jgi:hypothetical protein